MPKRKSDAAPGEASERADEGESTSPLPEAAAEDGMTLATSDEAAEPGSPDPSLPTPPAADPEAAIEAYREPEIATPEVAAAEAAAADRAEAAAAFNERPVPDPDDGRAVPTLSPPASAAEVVEEAHEHDEEAGGSLASKVLTALVLLLVGAGLALWGAPKLAPHLPSGLSGVAAWLSPGTQDAEARIDELAERLDARVGAVEARVSGLPAAADVDARVDAAVGTAATRLDGEVAALKEQIAGLGSGDLPQQVARLQSALDGQTTEFADLKRQLSGAEATSGQLSADAARQIDVYRSELEGLRTQVGSLQERVAGLATRLDQAEQRAEREVSAAQARVDEIRVQAETRLTAAQADAALAQVRAAIENGTPFEAPLKALGSEVAVPAGLAEAAAAGVETMAQLRSGYADAAHAAIRASIMASAGDGVLARARAFLGTQVASRSLTPEQGDSPDAVLSRVEDRLRQDDLDGALAEAGRLPSEARDAMAPWLAAAAQRAAAVDGLAALETAVAAAN